MVDCPPVYRNLQCESFQDKKKITAQMLRQFCKNDAYLYEQIMELWDKTDPESRKRFYPPDFMDESKSFGIESYNTTDLEKADYDVLDTVYRFSKVTETNYHLNFSTFDDKRKKTNDGNKLDIYDESIISTTGTAKKLEVFNDGTNSGVKPEITTGSFKTDGKQVAEVLGTAKKDAYCYGAYNNWHCNSFWYVGFNRSKNYNIKAEWKKKPDSYDIPAVCRAQTFKAENSGRVTKVALKMQGNKDAKSPCIVEIRPVNKKTGKPTRDVLARTEKKFTHSTGAIVNFNFKKGQMAEVKKGTTYAIVVRAPLNNFGKTYRLGGWARTCFSNAKKQAYYNGDAYLSEDNGKTWIHYGKNKDGKSYGAHWYDWGIAEKPLDFGFEVHVAPIKVRGTDPKTAKKVDLTLNYYNKGTYFLALKTLHANPIKSFKIHPEYKYANDSVGEFIWQYMNPKREWVDLNSIDGVIGHDFAVDNASGKYHYLKLRMKFKLKAKYIEGASSDYGNDKASVEKVCTKSKIKFIANIPYLSAVTIEIDSAHPTKGYLRTEYYEPDMTTMLGANIWSEVGAKVRNLKNSKATVEMDIIHKKELTDHVKLYNITNIELARYYNDYLKTTSAVETVAVDTDISSKILSDYANEKKFINYLANLPSPIYLLPDGDIYFFNTGDSTLPILKTPNLPAYPIISCEATTEDHHIAEDTIVGFDATKKYFKYTSTKDLSKYLSEIVVSYNIPSGTTQVYDENGYVLNDIDITEHIEEQLYRDIDTEESFVTNPNKTEDYSFADGTDYRVTKDGKNVIFNMDSDIINALFEITAKDGKNYLKFKTSAEIGGNTTPISNVELELIQYDNNYIEWVDYEIDYSTGEFKFYEQANLVESDLSFTYNPVWVRGLSSADLKLKLDIWTEEYVAESNGIYKLVKDVDTNNMVNGTFYTMENNKYRLKTMVAPRDNIRKLTVNGAELEEDVDFTVDYFENMVTFNGTVTSGDNIVVKYTPNLTDTGLALAYRLERPKYLNNIESTNDSAVPRYNDSQFSGVIDDIYILGNYFTYRT